MEKKKELTWNERHPYGNLCYYTFLDDFEGVTSLEYTTTKVALRVLKHHLEDAMGFELSDEQFIAIFFRVINLGPSRPLGIGSFQYGFVVPMQKTLQAQNLHCGVEEIFRFFNVRNYDNRRYHNLLLHIPHSSTLFPEDSKVSFNYLDEEERLLIDYYTDELFIPTKESEHIDSVVFPYCRLYCDVERLVNDPLEEKGLGIRYNRIIGHLNGHQLRQFNTYKGAFNCYADYHTMVSKKIMSMGQDLLLIDCHSYSALPNLLNSNPPDIDICIGYNEDETCPDKVVIGNIAQHFESRGYKVGVNNPFQNSKTFSVPSKYHSVMIEVNKRLYMNESFPLVKNDCFENVKQDIQSLYSTLLK